MGLTVGIALLSALCGAGELPERVEIRLSEGPHPCVFLTPEDLPTLRTRSREQAWARAVGESVSSAADALAAGGLDIPHAEGQWSHWYTCKEDGGRLEARSPTEHACQVCGTVYSGWPYDEVYITHRHGYWLRGVETLGVAYALEPKPAYAERVRAILLEYASFYSGLGLHDVHNNRERGARLFAQTLDESVVLCRVCMGYDMVYDAPCFSEQDHETIKDGFLLPMVRTIQANPRGISNWQSWHNAGVGCTGLLLRDEGLVDWAVNGESGFLYQMRHSLTPSGLWYEESPSYHWYALTAHVYLMEAAARAGIDLYAIPVVKGMFDAPLRQVLPDLTFVPFQDSDRTSILDQRAFYEVAYARFKDPAYLSLIPQRDSTWALVWGADELPEPPDRATLASSNAEGEGLAILRDAANETVAFLDYGPGTSGHVQPAKLGIVLYAHGDIRVVDPGRLPYGNPMHASWFRQTVAHNTVVVNAESQRKAPGHLDAFAATDAFSLCRATCEQAYPGVLLDRTLLLCGNTIVDVFMCRAAESATFDLPLHFNGTLAGLPDASPCDALGDADGYEHLRDVQRCADRVDSFGVDAGGGKSIHVRFHDDSDVFLAEGYGPGMNKRLPAVIRRQTGTQAVFVTVYQMLEPGETPRTSSAELDGKPQVRCEDIQLVLDDDTVVFVNEKRYRVTDNAVE